MQQDAPKNTPTRLASIYAQKQAEATEKKKQQAMEHALTTGGVTGHIGIAEAYAESRGEALQAKQEQQAAANDPKNNTLEAWRSSPIAKGLRLPSNDPRVLEEKRKLINGERP